MSGEPISLEDILGYLAREHGIKQLACAIDDYFTEWFTREKKGQWNRDAYLRYFCAKSVLDKIRKAVIVEQDPESPLLVEDLIEDLVEFIQRVRMPPATVLAGISSRAQFPFERFVPGTVVKVCVAKRMARNMGGQAFEANWLRASHGSRDVLAIADVVNMLGRERNLEFELDLEPVSPPSKEAIDLERQMNEADEVLKGLMEDSRMGAIVSLGSGPHNLVSNAIAKHIFDGRRDNRSVQFRWTNEDRQKIDFLNETGDLSQCASQHKAGVWYLQRDRAYFLRRDSDSAVHQQCQNAMEAGKYFYDCGMLAIDVRGRIPLILAAGHGGNATRACVQALGMSKVIAKRVNESSLKGRFIGCVVVARRKLTDNPVDDLTFAKQDRRSWYLYDMEDEPSGVRFPAIESFKIR